MLINMELARGTQLSDSIPLLMEIIIKLMVVSWALWAAMQGSEYFDWYYQGLSNQQVKTTNKQDTTEFVAIIAALDNTLADPALLASPLSLKDMATHLNVPIKKLSLAVNQIQGESYSKYLNRKRVLLAKDIMHRQPDVSMTVVMFDAGFRTKSSFNKEFKAIEGVSPSEYMHRNNSQAL
jgi:AraC-like DNA-binding protein